MPIRIYINNLAQVLRRANDFIDPRYVFYQAVLESDTVEDYMNKVGDIYVEPPTYKERMGAEREFKYMRDNRQWVKEIPYPPGDENDFASDGFRPDPENDARQRVLRKVITRQGQPRFRKGVASHVGPAAIR